MKHDLDFYLESTLYDEGLKDKFKTMLSSLKANFDKNENIFIKRGKQYIKNIIGSEQEDKFIDTLNNLLERLKRQGYDFSKNQITSQDLMSVANQPIEEDAFDKKANKKITSLHLVRRLIDDIRLPFVFVPILGMWSEVVELAKGTGGNTSAIFAQLIFALILILTNFIIEHKRFKKDDPESYQKEREEKAEILRKKQQPTDFGLRDPNEGEFE